MFNFDCQELLHYMCVQRSFKFMHQLVDQSTENVFESVVFPWVLISGQKEHFFNEQWPMVFYFLHSNSSF